MTTLALDQDFNFVDGQTLSILDGCDAVAQNVRVCVSLIPGESCLFSTIGIDYRLPIMRNERFASQIIRDKIQSVDGVDTVDGFVLTTDSNRDATFDFNIQVDGQFVGVNV